MAKYIELTTGQITIIDEADFANISQYSWNYHPSGYAIRTSYINGKKETIRLHRHVMGLGRGDRKVVDHLNGNGLDNRRANLRVTSQKNNVRRARMRRDNTSGYKGVNWRKKTNKWRATVKVNSINIGLGSFFSKEEAALAYNEAAIKYFGIENCILNEVLSDK